MARDPEAFPIADAVVEMGIIRIRGRVGRTPEESYRPRMALWIDQESGAILHMEMGEPADTYVPLTLRSLVGLGKRMDALPRQIQVRDPKLATDMKRVLDPQGIEVVVRESLPHLDEAVENLTERKAISGDPEPGMLDEPGMTLEHVTAFADAARVFYEARPWQHLTDDDLIEIESPAGPTGTRFTQVLGAGGRTFGLGFVGSREAHEQIRSGEGLPRGPIWNLLFDDLDSLAYDDGETWQRHNLPVAGPRAYPALCRITQGKGAAHPTPEQLVWAEGLMRAIAATTEDELDRGRWEKQVTTLAGPTTYKFSMPILLEQMAGVSTGNDPIKAALPNRMAMESTLRGLHQQLAAHDFKDVDEANRFLASRLGEPVPFEPTTDAERAQALCYEAYESRGRRQVQLARQALAIDPDCVDALVLLAERESDPASAIPLFQRAVEAGRRRLARELREDVGRFWGIIETRPFMRAYQALALTKQALGRVGEAVADLADLLRLNPNDNQGNRFFFAQALLEADQLGRLDELLNRSAFRDEQSAEWLFTRALLAFRLGGDTAEARRLVEEARAVNRHVAPLLTGRVPLPPHAPEYYSPGSEEEAVVAFGEIEEGWARTPGAVEWLDGLDAHTRSRARKFQREREKKQGKKRKRK